MTNAAVNSGLAVVTGCGPASGIGLAIAAALLHEGYRLAITATTPRIELHRRELDPMRGCAMRRVRCAGQQRRDYCDLQAARDDR